jgi:hydroxyacylglutathione hydrolase
VLVEKVVTGALQENCYVVGCAETHQAAVIDPGDDGEKILTLAAAQGLTITQILLTHAHFDHLGAVAGLQRATGAPVALHKGEKFNYKGLAVQAIMFGIATPESFKVATWLQGGEKIRIGSLELQVLSTPGHSPGGVCFYGHGQLFSGDVLFKNSIGRADLLGGDVKKLMNSIRSSLLVLPDETLVYPGHGSATTIGDEKKYNPFLRQL